MSSEEEQQSNSDVSASVGDNEGRRLAMGRRTFLKLSAATGTAVAVASAVSYSYLSPEGPYEAVAGEEITTEFINTSCLNCPTRCAITVERAKAAGDDSPWNAVAIHGNSASQVSDGQVCPRGHIGLQVLYDPDRIKTPLRRKSGAPNKDIVRNAKWDDIFEEISWAEALEEVAGRLNSVRVSAPEKLVLLHGLNSHSNEHLIRRFGETYGTPNVISAEALDNEAEKAGRWMAEGNWESIAYDMENTHYILAFGTSILESTRPLARNLRMWGKIRGEKAIRTKVVVIDPRYSLTASKADEWIPINPGTDGALAMAIAQVIINEGLYDSSFVASQTQGFDQYKAEAQKSEYSLDRVSEITGISSETIRRLAREFAQMHPAIAWSGRGPNNRPNGSYNAYAIFCLNALVGSIGVEGGIIYQEYPSYTWNPEDGVAKDSIATQGLGKDRVDFAGTTTFPNAQVSTNQVADSLVQDIPYKVEMAIGFNCNFNMSAPGTGRWDNALAKVPFYVHIAPFPSEMAQYADIILPTGTFLEEWGYDHCPAGSGFAELKIKQPVVNPLHDTKSIADIILELAAKLPAGVALAFEDIGSHARGFVQYQVASILANAHMSWQQFVGDADKGFCKIGPTHTYQYKAGRFEFYSSNVNQVPHYVEPEFMGSEAEFPFVLLPYQPVLNVENGSQNYPWAQEIYMVMHGRGWNNFVEINKEAADGLGIHDGNKVRVKSPYGEIEAKARVIEGIHPEVVAIACGQGHYRYGEWQEDIGVNPNEILGVDYDDISGQASFFNTRVAVEKA